MGQNAIGTNAFVTKRINQKLNFHFAHEELTHLMFTCVWIGLCQSHTIAAEIVSWKFELFEWSDDNRLHETHWNGMTYEWNTRHRPGLPLDILTLQWTLWMRLRSTDETSCKWKHEKMTRRWMKRNDFTNTSGMARTVDDVTHSLHFVHLLVA